MVSSAALSGELTSPADAQAATAPAENSSTMREETLGSTRDRRSVRDQNWTDVLQLPLRALWGEVALCFPSTSRRSEGHENCSHSFPWQKTAAKVEYF